MVMDLKETTELEELKQKHKKELLELQHKNTMGELGKQLVIEAVKSYPLVINQLHGDPKMKARIIEIAFDKNGHNTK